MTSRLLGLSAFPILLLSFGGCTTDTESPVEGDEPSGAGGENAAMTGGASGTGGASSGGGTSGPSGGASAASGGSDGAGGLVDPGKDPDGGDTLPKIFILAGQSNMQGQGLVTPGQSELDKNGGQGTLDYLVENSADPDVARLLDLAGDYIVRDDVWVEYQRNGNTVSDWLTVGQGSTGSLIGPELGFGIEVGDALESPVFLIKTAWGGKSLGVDFRPPSAGGTTGEFYTQMLQEVDEAIAKLDAAGQLGTEGYRIAGFGWHQGWNDGGDESLYNEYESNLKHLIRDLRAEWGVPEMPVVIGKVGHGGAEPGGGWMRALRDHVATAQTAVAEDPEFAATVTTVDTVPFYRQEPVSPADEGHHWHRNAESYYLIGLGMGAAMVDLLESAD